MQLINSFTATFATIPKVLEFNGTNLATSARCLSTTSELSYPYRAGAKYSSSCSSPTTLYSGSWRFRRLWFSEVEAENHWEGTGQKDQGHLHAPMRMLLGLIRVFLDVYYSSTTPREPWVSRGRPGRPPPSSMNPDSNLRSSCNGKTPDHSGIPVISKQMFQNQSL